MSQEYFRSSKTQSSKPGKKAKGTQSKSAREPLREGGVYKYLDGKLVLVEAGPIVDLQLTPGTIYKSRDGRPVRIYEINPGSLDFPVIGAIKDENDHWMPRVYNDKGISKRPYGEGNDIISEWSET